MKIFCLGFEYYSLLSPLLDTGKFARESIWTIYITRISGGRNKLSFDKVTSKIKEEKTNISQIVNFWCVVKLINFYLFQGQSFS